MPIKDIKITRDGKDVQIAGMDKLLFERVDISEYLELTKSIYDGEILTIQIIDSSSDTTAIYKKGILTTYKRNITNDNKVFALQYERNFGFKVSTENMNKLSPEEYEFLNNETKKFQRELFQIKNSFDESDLDNKESKISRLLSFYYVFYNKNLTAFDEQTIRKVQEMAALLNYLGINIIDTEFDYGFDKQNNMIISPELESLLEESFYISITKPALFDKDAELEYVDTLRKVILEQMPENTDFFSQICSLNRYLYNATIPNEQPEILDTVSAMLKIKKSN